MRPARGRTSMMELARKVIVDSSSVGGDVIDGLSRDAKNGSGT